LAKCPKANARACAARIRILRAPRSRERHLEVVDLLERPGHSGEVALLLDAAAPGIGVRYDSVEPRDRIGVVSDGVRTARHLPEARASAEGECRLPAVHGRVRDPGEQGRQLPRRSPADQPEPLPGVLVVYRPVISLEGVPEAFLEPPWDAPGSRSATLKAD